MVAATLSNPPVSILTNDLYLPLDFVARPYYDFIFKNNSPRTDFWYSSMVSNNRKMNKQIGRWIELKIY